MRTVSFSDPKVRRLLSNNFVNTFTNTYGDSTSGLSIAHRPSDPPGPCIRGNGKQNVQTIFMTPDGEIFHVATGFLAPEDLAEEARYANSLFQEIVQQEPETVRDRVSTSHKDRLFKAGFSEQEIVSRSPFAAMMMFNPATSGNLNLMSGPGERSPGNFGSPQGIFDGFIKQQFLQDNQFSIQNPLMSWQQLQNDPTTLVGRGKSFFASSGSN